MTAKITPVNQQCAFCAIRAGRNDLATGGLSRIAPSKGMRPLS
jgi:hypothetical protein